MVTFIAVLLILFSPGQIGTKYVGEYNSKEACEQYGTATAKAEFPNNQAALICVRKETI